jgi:hypothetical protein
VKCYTRHADSRQYQTHLKSEQTKDTVKAVRKTRNNNRSCGFLTGGGFGDVDGVYVSVGVLWDHGVMLTGVTVKLVLQVRAAALSGDCDWLQEAWRGQVSPAVPSTWLGYHRRCVARRAALSVALNARCGETVSAYRDDCMCPKFCSFTLVFGICCLQSLIYAAEHSREMLVFMAASILA